MLINVQYLYRPPHQKRTENDVETTAGTFDSDSIAIKQDTDNRSACLERPCPRVIFRRCPKECPFSCEFQSNYPSFMYV